MLCFEKQSTEKQNVVTLSRQLSWPHFIELFPVKNPEAKLFYAHQVSS